MAFATAGTSTIFASITFHAAPNAADPAAVIRSTTCDGGSDGGMTGSGGATGGACATESEEIITGIAASAAQAARLLRYFRRIFSSRLIVNFDFVLSGNGSVSPGPWKARRLRGPLSASTDARMTIRAFSGKVDTGFPQKMRPNKEARARSDST